jgi:hypothetical protein
MTTAKIPLIEVKTIDAALAVPAYSATVAGAAILSAATGAPAVIAGAALMAGGVAAAGAIVAKVRAGALAAAGSVEPVLRNRLDVRDLPRADRLDRSNRPSL